MPNCYLAPLVEKPGCRRIFVEEGPQFGLNDLGQETTARRLCLERAREELGNSWVFRLQRCEVWNCTSLKALRRSADSGPPDDGVLLQDPRGRILATGKEHEVVVEDHYVASLALVLEPHSPHTSRLRSSDGHYVTAEAARGFLEASGNRETGVLFNITKEDGGWVSLRHPSGGRLRCNGRCTLGDAEGDQLFRLVPSEALRESWSANNGDGRAWVHSQLCNYQEPYGGEGGRQRRSASYVKLWEWNYADVQQECRDVLGPAGVDAVQLSPVTEHILGHQWWVRYQPISASLNSRSGSAEQLREAVAECRKAGVEVVVDVVLNHMARPCSAAQGAPRGTPCVGWNGTSYGNRRTAGARGWDMASPQHFHHGDKEIWGECGVGPDTGFLCGSPITTDCSCCPCDMYGLPDWNLAVKAVQESHTRHLEELHHMGVTMLRIDAALYMEPELMSSILNRFPWDVVYQEWWHELPLPGRTDVFGLYRDLKFMRRVSEFLAVQDISRTQEVLDVDRGDFYIHPVEAVYPTCFHDGRSDGADPAIPTFKNGLAFHQQQLFLLASPFPVTVVLWGGYAWRSIDDGPPGCEGGQSHCAATSPQSEGCRATPTTSPSPPLEEFTARPWICEHRWQGVAGLLRFRASCRHAETRRWTPGGPEHLRLGHLAFRLGSRCFVALARGSDWWLADRPLDTGLPMGRYCDLASFDGRTCHREVVLGPEGRVLKGGVAAGHLLAISAAVMQP